LKQKELRLDAREGRCGQKLSTRFSQQPWPHADETNATHAAFQVELQHDAFCAQTAAAHGLQPELSAAPIAHSS
jgi:hypothetical protein